MMLFWKKWLWIPTCLALLGGCGYHVAGKETHSPPGLKSVAVPSLKNQTLEPGIESHFTQAFLRQFIKDRRVNVVDRKEADAVLEGTVKSFYLLSSAYDRSGFATEFQTIVVMDIVLKKRNGDVLWKENDLVERAWYRTSPSVVISEDNKQNAIQKVAESVAERVVNRFFYNF
jgi:outer membrane lipopolysaccharide assembly protein LptE/RlpB